MIIQLACRKVFGSLVMSNRRIVSNKFRHLLTFLGYILCGYAYNEFGGSYHSNMDFNHQFRGSKR